VSKTGVFSAFFGKVAFGFSEFSKRAKKMSKKYHLILREKLKNEIRIAQK